MNHSSVERRRSGDDGQRPSWRRLFIDVSPATGSVFGHVEDPLGREVWALPDEVVGFFRGFYGLDREPQDKRAVPADFAGIIAAELAAELAAADDDWFRHLVENGLDDGLDGDLDDRIPQLVENDLDDDPDLCPCGDLWCLFQVAGQPVGKRTGEASHFGPAGLDAATEDGTVCPCGCLTYEVKALRYFVRELRDGAQELCRCGCFGEDFETIIRVGRPGLEVRREVAMLWAAIEGVEEGGAEAVRWWAGHPDLARHLETVLDACLVKLPHSGVWS